MNRKRVYVAGHRGMVGSAIVRKLQSMGDVDLVVRSKNELDLLNQGAVLDFFGSERIDEIYLAAAKVGGIHANNAYPADFIYENLMIECNIINAAHKSNINRLLYLGSSCIYPKYAEQPISEQSLLCGKLEETNEPYAIAKIAGIKLCESYNRQHGRDYRSVMPTNLYGPNDNFHLENSHVIPALMRRIHEAKEKNEASVIIWGSGAPKREFLHVDDMASACIHIINLPAGEYWRQCSSMDSHVNIGTGVDCTIKELALSLAEIIGFQGGIVFDTSKPDGTPRKLLDVRRLEKMGWAHSIELIDGLRSTYNWFLGNEKKYRS